LFNETVGNQNEKEGYENLLYYIIKLAKVKTYSFYYDLGGHVQISWTILTGESPVKVIIKEPFSYPLCI